MRASARPQARGASLPYFALGTGAFLALYLPQPLLPDLDRDLHTAPAVTGLVMTASLLGFAFAGLLPERDPQRTLRRAMWLTAAASLVAALSPGIWLLLPARLGQGIGIGLLVAGGLADVPRRLAPQVAGRVTGAMISGTAFGGLVGRGFGYLGLFLTWRGAMLVGAAGVLAIVGWSLSRLPGARTGAGTPRPVREGRVPVTLVLAGAGILFVSVGMFDLLPYRLSASPFRLPPALADLIYLVFLAATAAAVVSGRAVDRWGPRIVIVGGAGAGIACLLVGILPSLPAVALAAAGGISGTVALHVAHSGAAARYGRAAVGYYLAAYYVGGAASAPLMAAAYQRWGWTAVMVALSGAWLVVALLAAARHDPDRPQGQRAEADVAPAGALG